MSRSHVAGHTERPLTSARPEDPALRAAFVTDPEGNTRHYSLACATNHGETSLTCVDAGVHVGRDNEADEGGENKEFVLITNNGEYKYLRR